MTTADATPDLLTPEQAAEYLQLNRETVYRYIREGKLEASRLGRSYRVTRQGIALLLEATRTRPDIRLRDYTPEQLGEFAQADALDEQSSEAAERIRFLMDDVDQRRGDERTATSR